MNNKGFTLLEMMIVVAIVAILATTATVSLKGRAERNARIKARNMIPMFLNNAVDRAFEEGRSYTLDFDDIDEDTPIIEMTGEINKEITLPKALKYSSNKNEIKLSSRGEFDKKFEIKVKDRDGTELFKIEGTTISGIGLGKVEVVN